MKLPFDDNVKSSDDPMDDVIMDHKVSQVVRTPKIKFDLNPVVHQVPTQYDIYGCHPRDFDFDHQGRMLSRVHNFEGRSYWRLSL